jgi:hypothetical protein
MTIPSVNSAEGVTSDQPIKGTAKAIPKLNTIDFIFILSFLNSVGYSL